MPNASPLEIYERVYETLPANYIKDKNKLTDPVYLQDSDPNYLFHGRLILKNNQNHQWNNFALASDNYEEFELDVFDEDYFKLGEFSKGDLFQIVNNGKIGSQQFYDGDLVEVTRDILRTDLSSSSYKIIHNQEKNILRKILNIYSRNIGYSEVVEFYSSRLKLPFDFYEKDRVYDDQETLIDHRIDLSKGELILDLDRYYCHSHSGKYYFSYFPDLRTRTLDQPLPTVFDEHLFEELLRHQYKYYNAEFVQFSRSQNLAFDNTEEDPKYYGDKIKEIIDLISQKRRRIPFIYMR